MVFNEIFCSLASLCLSPVKRNSVFEELRVKRQWRIQDLQMGSKVDSAARVSRRRGVGCGEGVSPYPLEEGCPLPRKFF